ncbi:hypothetical protein FB446DRAFT_776542, partial [Lentinula raphanica]
MNNGLVGLNQMAGLSSQATAASYHPQVFDRPMSPPSVCPPSIFTCASQDESMQTLQWPIPPVGYTSNPASVTFISIPSSSTILSCHSMEADVDTPSLSLSPPELLDEVMVDLEDIMDVDEVYGGTERSGIAGEGDEEMSATLEDVVLDIKSGDDADHDRMIVDAGQSSVFDVFVEYFASVMRPGSWMDIDLSGCGGWDISSSPDGSTTFLEEAFPQASRITRSLRMCCLGRIFLMSTAVLTMLDPILLAMDKGTDIYGFAAYRVTNSVECATFEARVRVRAGNNDCEAAALLGPVRDAGKVFADSFRKILDDVRIQRQRVFQDFHCLSHISKYYELLSRRDGKSWKIVSFTNTTKICGYFQIASFSGPFPVGTFLNGSENIFLRRERALTQKRLIGKGKDFAVGAAPMTLVQWVQWNFLYRLNTQNKAADALLSNKSPCQYKSLLPGQGYVDILFSAEAGKPLP